MPSPVVAFGGSAGAGGMDKARGVSCSRGVALVKGRRRSEVVMRRKEMIVFELRLRSMIDHVMIATSGRSAGRGEGLFCKGIADWKKRWQIRKRGDCKLIL